jgi:DNA uptake protein and related DNA-binding proteins
VDQSATPWRVFDAPAPGETAAGTQSQLGGDPRKPSLARPRLALASLAGAIAIGGLALVLAIGGTGGETIDGPRTAAGASGSDDPVAASGAIVVDVSGAVVAPGVYRLATGARVGDAITAAGGFSRRVDAARVGTELNLAAPLSDGAQVRVPSRDDSAPSASAGGGSGAGGAGTPGKLVNLNAATQAELEALPGIGPVSAGKIIESRAQSAFKAIDDLRSRGLVGQKTFDKIRALLTVG